MKKSCFVDWESLRFECSRRHELRDEDDVLAFRQGNFPIVVEANDVGMLESFEHLGLFSEPLPLTFVQFLLLCKQKNRSIIYGSRAGAYWLPVKNRRHNPIKSTWRNRCIHPSRISKYNIGEGELDCRNTRRQNKIASSRRFTKEKISLSYRKLQRNAIE